MKRKKIKIGLILFLSFGLAFSIWSGLKLKRKARANTNDNLIGYAWSSNIGWISMNCENTGCGSSNYGVNIDTSFGGPDEANLEGYAWSSNIGWINFAPADSPPDSGDTVQMDLDTHKITGWARTENSTDENYGWIKFGYGDQGTYIGSEGKMDGWLWGGGPDKEAVIGWISTQGSNYGIRAKNAEPYVTATDKDVPDHSELCTASQPGDPAATYDLSWVFNDDDDIIDDYQNDYEIELTDGDGNTYIYSPSAAPNTPDGGTTTVSFSITDTVGNTPDDGWLYYGKDYEWEVRVQDSSWEQAWSDPAGSSWESGPNLDVPWKYPMPSFTWEPAEPRVAEPVEFDGSASEAYAENPSLSIEDPVLWKWDFGDGEATTSPNATTTHTYDETGKYTVSLAVTDQYGKTCTTTRDLKVEPKPDRWEEVLPR